MIHLEGMGLLGSLIANALYYANVKFTWHDTDNRYNAWQACTGAIYPAGKPGSLDFECYAAWRQVIDLPLFEPYVEVADYTFNHLHAPHEGQYRTTDIGHLRVSELESLHLNAQTFVPATRERFAAWRAPPKDNKIRVVSHGFNNRLTHVYSGWTRKVKLRYHRNSAKRMSLYLRRGRFVMCYAYPVPSESWWYAGSALIKQTAPRELEMQRKYETWCHHLQELTAGTVEVEREGPFMQGWRPAQEGLEMEMSAHWVRPVDGRLHIPPLWHSGLRHAPKVVNDLLDTLGISNSIFQWSPEHDDDSQPARHRRVG